MPGPTGPSSSRRSSPASAAMTPCGPACHPFSFARVRTSPVPSPQLPQPPFQGPSPHTGLPFSRTPCRPTFTSLLSKVTPNPLLLPPSSNAPYPFPLQKGQSVLACAAVAPGPHSRAPPAHSMAAAIGKARGPNVLSRWNSETFSGFPAGSEPLIWGLLRTDNSGCSSHVGSAGPR